MVLKAHAGNSDGVAGMNRAAIGAIEQIAQARQNARLGNDAANQALRTLLDYETLPSHARERAKRALDSMQD